MNKNLIILLIGGAAIYFFIKRKKTTATDFATKRYRVVVRKTSKLYVRDEPNMTGNILMYLYFDQIIYAKEYNNEWLVFTINNDPNGQLHYVNKQYLTEVN